MPGIGFVKLSDVLLTKKDYIGSTAIAFTPNGEESVTFTENDIFSDAEEEQDGIRGVQSIFTIVDINKANNSGFNCKTTGTYGVYYLDGSAYIKSFSKTTIEIKEDVLPELPSGANMEKGAGVEATQQIPRSAKTNKINAQGQLCFEGDSPYMTPEENAEVPFGALAEASVSLGGRTSAQNTHSMAVNSKTIAKGEESLATGYATIALGGASFSGGSQTIARAEASVALGHKTDAAAPYTFLHGVQLVANGEYQAGFGIANDNKIEDLFEIGNGRLDENGNVLQRSNAFCVTRDGRAKVQNLDLNQMEEDDLVSMSVLGQIENVRSFANGNGDNSIQQKGCSANAINTVALGLNTVADGDVAYADGLDTQASGYYSHASGQGTIADKLCQTVLGRYNAIGRSGSIFIIGIGDSDDNRRNGLEVLQDGEIIIRWKGDYYSLNLMLNLISDAHGGSSFFDAAKK